MPMPRRDLTGKRFGRLTVVRAHDSTKGQLRWECICDCGATTIVFGTSLKGGSTKSCGCLLRDFNKTLIVHGSSPRRLYRIWCGMRRRCNDKTDKDYARYGGRGITVCPEWSDYAKFRDWAFANGYQETLTLDRVDNDGSYNPSNCRWATAAEQANNRRNNHKVSYMGETKNISEWAHYFGLDPGAFHAAIRRGRTVGEILKYAEVNDDNI